MKASKPESAPASLPSDRVRARRRAWRMLKDRLARWGVSIGGVGVIVAITLIFFYLAWVVLPLFKSASAEPAADYPVPGGAGRTMLLAMEEQAEIGVRFTADARVVFFRTADGGVIDEQQLSLPDGVEVRSFAVAEPASGLVAYGLSDGRALVLRHKYKVSFPAGKRLITPQLGYPFGEAPMEIDSEGRPLTHLSLQTGEERTTLVAAVADGPLLMVRLVKEESFLSDTVEVQRETAELPALPAAPAQMLLTPEQDRLYVLDSADELHHFRIQSMGGGRHLESLSLMPAEIKVSSLALLSGGISLLVGGSDGRIEQYFPVRDKDGRSRLTRIRGFHEQGAAITALAPEYARKGFVAADASGRVAVYHTTAHRVLLDRAVTKAGLEQLAIGPRPNALLAQDDNGRLHFWRLENEHPEVSWSSLWGKVWYEGYPEPDFVWQSSAATETFEPKLSLTPISFGTLKAAFYAMIFAVPLAVLGAIFTAHFMTPQMRQLVKPSIEIMEALPTVILGFLAGLWLAPVVEQHLPGFFLMLIFLPVGVLGFAYLWTHLPNRIRHWLPEGWEALLLMVPVVLMVWLSISLSPMVEETWFGGDMRKWLHARGIEFDQRNSIVVGLAMGFAVIPTIFSITEDAIFGVPKHLSHGSLALGATPWQTLWRVVLLTASPGIFSAVMIGLGRAVGETMIVLMATGSTPIMDLSIFQGMRTLSANIAVEMPESEVNSTHFRVLFLAGLVLFLFTFFFNTLAELVRQRLRRKYSSL